MDTEKYLNRLLGKVLNSTSIITNTVLPINNNGKELLTIANSLKFEEYKLEINNPISIMPSDIEMENLIGLKVSKTEELTDSIEIVFSNGIKLIIDMRDEAYYDPEAMCLSGPNDFWVVWN